MNTSAIISTNNNNQLVNIKNGIASCGHKVATIYSKSFHAPNNLVEHLEDNCAICLFPIINDRKIALLEDCRHIYHSECIDEYLKNHNSCCICISSVMAEYEYNSVFEFIHDELDYCNQPSCDNNNKTKVKKYAIKKFYALDEIKNLSKDINFLAKNIQTILPQIKNKSSLYAIPSSDISTINTSVAHLCYRITQENSLIQNFRNELPNNINEIIRLFDRKKIYKEARYIQTTINTELLRRKRAQREKRSCMIYTFILYISSILSIAVFLWNWDTPLKDVFADKLTCVSDKHAIFKP